MRIAKLGHKSQRRITINDVFSGGEILKIGKHFYLCPVVNDDEGVKFDGDEFWARDYVLVNLETGLLEAFDGDTACGWVKNAQLNFYEDESLEWTEIGGMQK